MPVKHDARGGRLNSTIGTLAAAMAGLPEVDRRPYEYLPLPEEKPRRTRDRAAQRARQRRMKPRRMR
jgi:hypothetical protein